MQNEASVAVSPPRLLARRSQPSAPPRTGSRLRTLLGLNSVDTRSDLHDTMYVVPRPAADAHDMRVFENVARAYEGTARECENARTMASTPDPGCSGGMGRGLLPRLLEMITTPKRKGKAKAIYDADGELLPLDGEEGELIDDEACFMEPHESDGIDILLMLPPELALHILCLLDLDSIIACLAVSHAWRRLASDDTVWRTLFYRQPGWFANLSRRRAQILASLSNSPAQLQSQPRSPSLLSSLSLTSSRRASTDPSRFQSSSSHGHTSHYLVEPSLNWPDLFKQRYRVARKWYFGAAKSTKLAGHLDSVYCLELDTASDTIVTGSRDRTIKIWSVRTGELKETLVAHEGSVLCLKVELAKGFMCSGSSDRTIRIWARVGGPWEVRAVLSGHAGGVLDLRMDDRWIVSWYVSPSGPGPAYLIVSNSSKDTFIRVWDRQTLNLHCLLKGHDGPVNAVGLQGNHVVSASGDGTMILWDVESGSRVRTFAGHDKGLACVEFKGDTIISGSNDRKIKVWSASSGECLVTLPGHELLVRALAYDAVSRRLVSASYDRTIKVWEFGESKDGWKLVREFRNLHDSHIFDVKFDATKIVSTSHDQKILVLDFAYDVDGQLFI
ncbi:F-box and WD40 domain containing protein [Ceratobasidium theobromae]|uniref:F-box and WD40 domain containing protein n=1 Tax=Ceratobasidium theobromae TaxID=1582974 RepID=A0A5N5QAM7_9AGAM|nr:F-box and WD40 domain containing protein [Ceratobasidium theobromae]